MKVKAVKKVVCSVLRGVEYVALREGNRGERDGGAPTSSLRAGVDDLLKAHRMCGFIGDAESLLDVGCGNGRRLEEMSLFRPKIKMVGVDIAVREPPHLPGAACPEIRHFDGQKLPFEDQQFDVSQICYVLHHLNFDQSQTLLQETMRVTRRRLLLLEDSLAEWTLPYRIRNWAHLTESNLRYAEESGDFGGFYGTSGFLSHQKWIDRLGSMQRVLKVEVDPLESIKRYRHHTLFVVDLE